MHMFACGDSFAREADDLVIAAHRCTKGDSMCGHFVPRRHHAFDRDPFTLQLRATDQLRAGDHHVVVRMQAYRELDGSEHGLGFETSANPNATSFL